MSGTLCCCTMPEENQETVFKGYYTKRVYTLLYTLKVAPYSFMTARELVTNLAGN